MKNQVHFIHFCVFWLLAGLLLYTRYVGLDWGLPFPMHPDERNMVIAIEQFQCPDGDEKKSDVPSDVLFSSARSWVQDCFHPHFFAYGQFPLYTGAILVKGYYLLQGRVSDAIHFEEGTLALRVLSATASVGAALFLLLLIRALGRGDTYRFSHPHGVDGPDKEVSRVGLWFSDARVSFWLVSVSALCVIFSPGFIQFAHFGTTESLLMFFYVVTVFLTVRLVQGGIPASLFAVLSGLVCGMALATKLTGVVFAAIPVLGLILYFFRSVGHIRILYNSYAFFSSVLIFGTIVLFVSVLLSPYNVLAWQDFLGALRYESDVATGAYVAFYTRQFEQTIPVIFQIFHVLPYALGSGMFLFSLFGLFFLPWKRMDIAIVRAAIIIFVFSQVVLFAKWSRFLAPVLPLLVACGVLIGIFLSARVYDFFQRFRAKRIVLSIGAGAAAFFLLCILLPGMAYTSVYVRQDVRFAASEWMYENIPAGASLLSETANVIDIPVRFPSYEGKTPAYDLTSFNFYDLDTDPSLQMQFARVQREADYIIVPSRRVYANHTCVQPASAEVSLWRRMYTTIFSGYIKKQCAYRGRIYPRINAYYNELFGEGSEFELVHEVTRYPRVSILGYTFYEAPDEYAEETWTVFDHPVVRIYKRK